MPYLDYLTPFSYYRKDRIYRKKFKDIKKLFERIKGTIKNFKLLKGEKNGATKLRKT